MTDNTINEGGSVTEVNCTKLDMPNPVIDQAEIAETTKAIDFNDQEVKKRRKVETHVNADLTPPAWFGPAVTKALAQALVKALIPLRIDCSLAYNASAQLPLHVLKPVLNDAGEAPRSDLFPENVIALVDLTEEQLNELLLFYGYGDNGGGGSLEGKRNRLARHIGVRFSFRDPTAIESDTE